MKRILLITLVSAMFTNVNAQVSNTDLVASYNFEQNTNAANSSTFNGTVNGTVTYGQKNGSAIKIANTVGSQYCDVATTLECTGGYSKGSCLKWTPTCPTGFKTTPASNNYVSLPLSNSVISDNFTISFWLNPDQNNSFPWNNIISKRLDKSIGKTILYNSVNISISNSTTLYAGVTTTSGTEVNITTPITTGTWTYVTYTYDGSNVKLYKNGVLAAESSASGSVEFNTSTKWVLGQISDLDNSQGGNFTLDDLHIYARALSATEVEELKNSGITAIEDDNYTTKYTISPNPANEFVNLPVEGEIYDLLGNKVAEGVGNVSVANLTAGIYLVKIGAFTQKLIKN